MQIIYGFPPYSNGKCIVCGWAGLDNSRAILDTEITVEETNLYFCEFCAKNIGHEIGLVEKPDDADESARVAALIATQEEAGRYVRAVTDAISDLRNVLPELVSLVSPNVPKSEVQSDDGPGEESDHRNSSDGEPVTIDAPNVDPESDFIVDEGSSSLSSSSSDGWPDYGLGLSGESTAE